MATKTKAQLAIEELNKKYGITGSTATVNNNSVKQSDKGKQSKSASSNVKNEGVKTKAQLALEKLNQKYGISGTTTPTKQPAKKYTDFNGEKKKAYTSAKNRVNTKTTITSNLSEEARKARIKEIESEMRNLNYTLEGIGLAGSYGGKANREQLKIQREKAQKRQAELSEELKKLKRVGTFSASELKQFEIEDAKAKKAALPNYNPTARIMPSQADALAENVKAHSQIDKEIDRLEREKALYDDISKFGDVVNKDNFGGQWRANYRNNELSREADKAMSEYLKNPTEENLQIAYAYDAFAKEYHKNNEKALDDENVKSSWLTKSMAGYLPQFKDQIVPELVGGGLGGLIGGSMGAGIGAGLGTYAQSYDVIRGSVYRTLLAEGVDEQTAKKAAEDEALISSLIESGETAIGWLLAGGGKALSAIGTAAKTSVAKGSTNAATKFVSSLAGKATDRAASKAAKAVTRPLWNKALRVTGGVVGNAFTEYGEEFTQGAVSIANRERALNGTTPIDGKGQLVAGASKVVADAVTGDNPDAFAELHEQGKEGFKIGLMFGGTNTIVNNVISHYANAKTVKLQNEILDTIIEDEESLNALIEEGKASGKGTVSENIATEIETARANGKEITREQVKRLIASNETYIQAEEQTTAPTTLEQTAKTVVNERKQTSTPTYERLEALSQSNEPIAVEDVKKVTGFGEEGSKMVAELANSDGVTFSQAERIVKNAYMVGFTNVDGTKVNFETDTQIDAYTAGRKDRAMQDISAKEKAKNATVYDGTFTENEYTKNFTNAEKKMVSTIAKSFGMNVSVVDKIIANVVNGKVYEANAEHQDGKMRISSTTEKVISEIVLHEGGHRMRQLAPTEFGVLMDALYARADGRSLRLGVSQNLIFDNIKAQHDNAGITMDTSGYMEEFAVRELETIFESPEAFNKWYAEISGNQEVKTAWQKFMDFISELIENVKQAIATAKMSKEERAEAKKELAELERIKELYANTYKAAENAVAEKGKTNTIKKTEKTVSKKVENIPQFSLKSSNNGIYDYTKSFAQQVDDWKKGLIPQNDSLLVGATPKVFKKIGFNPLPFTINQRHIDYAINGTKDIDHSLGEALLSQLPQALENPLAIISSQTQPDRVVAILKIQYKGKNIVAPVDIDGYGTQNNVSIDSNAITSVFGKGNAITKLLIDALNSEAKGSISVFYWNKKEALSLLQTPGLQLPSHLPQDGFIHSITENGSPVKQRLKNITESQQFKRWFGNSKVVNKDGTPKILYHQTANDFTVFDTRHEGAGRSDNETPFGIFLKPTSEKIGVKGDIQMPLYASIRNPLEVANRGELVKALQTMSSDFANLYEEHKRLDKEYQSKFDEATKQFREYITKWRAANPDASRQAIYDDPGFNEVFEAEGRITDEWSAMARVLELKTKEVITKALKDNDYDGMHILEDAGSFGKTTETYIALEPTQVKSATDNIGTFDGSNPDIQFSLKETDNINSKDREELLDTKISYSDKMVVRDGMTDEERYNILVNKGIENVPMVDNEKLGLIESKLITPISEVYRLKATDRKKLFVKIGEEFGIFKNYTNEDIEVDFEFTKGGMRESEQHQNGNYETFAKLFSCFDEVIDRAIGIEVHNRNSEGYKVDVSLKEMYVLVSAFEDGEYIVPVKLEIKEFSDKENKLYVAIALESIKKNEVVKEGNTNNSVTQTSRSFNISLSQLLKNVNPKDQDFIKYIPKQFFEENKATYSLKGGVSVTELFDTIDDMRSGKRQASTKLSKYVDSGAISTELYKELIDKYGVIPNGEKPHRDIQVPKKTAKNKKVSQTVRTILEAKATPDEAIPTIEKMVEDGIFSYDAYTDKQAIADEEAYLKEHGWITSFNEWIKDVNQGVVSKQHTVMGWALYNNAVNTAATTTSENERKTATQTAITILDAMVRHQRSAAQALQATRILKKLTPETQLYAVQKSVKAFQKELTDKYGNKAPELKINEELAEQFLNAKTEDERMAAEIEIYKDIGRQMPSDWLDKWNALRYLSMLGNLRTHVRNIVGNAGFAPVVNVKNIIAAGIESGITYGAKLVGKEMSRSKTFLNSFSKHDRALISAAYADYANVADAVSNGGKYNDSAMGNQYIQKGRTIFKSNIPILKQIAKGLEWARKGNSYLLELEDVWFSKPHYAYALAMYCKANNITPEQIQRGKAIAPAREYAIREASKATYRDINAFSHAVSSLGRNGAKENENGYFKAGRIVVEGIQPFRKTPANILVRGVEYSPLGLIKGIADISKIGKETRKGFNKGYVTTATEVIDRLSAGLTGTGLYLLGWFMARAMLVRGHGEDDEKEKEFKEMMGHQAYSFETSDGKSYTLDWLAPEALPFFMGVNTYEIYSRKNPNERLTMSDMITVATRIGEPMLKMSCLQGINDALENIGYAKQQGSTGIESFLYGAATSYLMQGLPTLFGQAERTGEEYRMETYTEKNAFLTGDMQYTLGKASNKIPFWEYSQIPYIDAWGRKEASGVALKRGLNNFLNPAYTSTIEESKMEKELLRLYEKTGEGGVFPSRADKYFTVNGKRKDLTSEQYVRYATLKGQKSYKAVSNLVSSDAYKQLSDTEKAKAVTEAYDYANQKAKEAISNYKPDTWVNKADEFGSNVGSYLSFRANVSDTREDNGGKISKQEVVDIILDMAQNDSDMWKMYLSEYESKSDMYAYDNGIDGETYMRFLEILDEVDTPNKTGKYGTYTQDEARKAVNQLEGLSRQEKAALWQSVNTTWKRNPF